MELVDKTGAPAMPAAARTLFQFDAATGNLNVLSPAGLIVHTMDAFEQAVMVHNVLSMHLARATGQGQSVEVKIPIDNPAPPATPPDTIGHQALRVLADHFTYWNNPKVYIDPGWYYKYREERSLLDISPELSAALRAMQSGK